MAELSKSQQKCYAYWRETQRNQLGTSSHIYMIFAAAILGFVLNLLLNHSFKPTGCAKTILIVSSFSLVLSLLVYGLFTNNRLNDFRNTARLTKCAHSEKEIGNITRIQGQITW